MKVLLLIASHGRHHLTSMCYTGVQRMIDLYAKIDIELIPFIACSSDDDIKQVQPFGFNCGIFPNDPLGNKLNKALQYAWQSDYDYLMQLGSDDLMSDDGVLFTAAYMRQGVEMFGFTSLYIIEYETRKCKLHEGSTVWGAGRCIHSRIINDLRGKLWTPTLNRGLDNDSRARIASNCRAKPTVIKTPLPCILDIKTRGENINSFDTFGACYASLPHQFPELNSLFSAK